LWLVILGLYDSLAIYVKAMIQGDQCAVSDYILLHHLADAEVLEQAETSRVLSSRK
jgi:hypothetical protein